MTADEVEVYMNRLGKIYESTHKENPYVSILYGDFNSRSPVFWERDPENYQGRLFNDFLIAIRLEEIINEPCHVLPNLH